MSAPDEPLALVWPARVSTPSKPLRPYNRFTGDARAYLGRVHAAMLRRYPQFRKARCEACGTGPPHRVHQHLEDYNDSLHGIIGLCVLCHVAVHERFRYPIMWDRYRTALRRGARFDPVDTWWAGITSICSSDAGYRAASKGRPRDPGILDEIATGKFLTLGPRPGGAGGHADRFCEDAATAGRLDL